MRLTVVSPYDPAPPSARDAAQATVGGVERVLGRLAAEVARQGHDVTLLCSTATRSRASWEDGVRVVRVRRRATMFRAPVASLARHLPRETDLVHVPATYPFTTGPVLGAARALGVPAVLDFHFEPSPPGLLGETAAAAYAAYGPRAYRLADAVLVRSRAYALTAPSLRGLEARWRVVPNGVDAARFRPGAGGSAGDYLLVVGRLVPYKGIEVLLRALAMVRGAPPLVVAGEGPLRARLEAEAQRLGLDARFMGRVSDEALPELYRGAKLTVLPSVNRQEAFGITLVESMACGTPVVASDLPGVAEVARLGGLVAPPGDAPALAEVLQRALQPGALPRGEALAARVRAEYDWPVIAARVLAVYEEVLGAPLRAPPREVVRTARARRDPVL